MERLLATQTDYLLFLGTLSFLFFFAMSMALRQLRHAGLPWGKIAVFALAQGMFLWMRMLSLGVSGSTLFSFLRIITLVLSATALLEFARSSTAALGYRTVGYWILGLTAIPAIIGIFSGPEDIECSVRVILLMPACLWSGVILWYAAENEHTNCSHLKYAGVALILYGIVSLVTPRSGDRLLPLFFGEIVFSTDGVWWDFFATVFSICLAAFTWNYLCTLRRTLHPSSIRQARKPSERMINWALLLILTCGGIATFMTGRETTAELRRNIVRRAELSAAAISLEYSFTRTNTQHPSSRFATEELKEQLTDLVHASSDIKRISILERNQDDRRIVLALEKGPSNLEALKFDENPEIASFQRLLNLFERGSAFAADPISDSDGTSVAAYAPIRDSQSGAIIGALKLETLVNDWSTILARRRLPLILVTALLAFLASLAFVLHRQGIEASRRIAESESRFRAVFEQVSEAIVMLDHEGRIQFANPPFETLIGIRLAECIGRFPTSLTQIEDREFLQLLERRATTKALAKERVFLHRSKNSTAILDAMFMPIQHESGETGHVVAMRDVTYEQHLEKQVRQAQKMEAVGTLAGGIAHDFNNILMAILGYAEMAIAKLSSESHERDHLEQIIKAAERAAALVRQILAFSRERESDIKPIPIAPAIKETLTLLRSSLPTTIQIRQEIQPDCGFVLADPTQIHQILMNLCTNAYQAMGSNGGTLTVSLKHVQGPPPEISLDPEQELNKDWLCLAVSDTGCGIDATHLERIFDPFFTTKPIGEGTGLGLATTHGIVTSYGGTINVTSTVGKGSTFSVYLPRCDVPAAEPAPLPQPSRKGSERILYVDDEEALAAMCSEMLAAMGYEVKVFTTPEHAITEFRMDPKFFDLIISDQMMPGMTGMELAREAHALNPNIPIVLLTGYSETISEHETKACGIRKILSKPISAHDLHRRIRIIFDGEEGKA